MALDLTLGTAGRELSRAPNQPDGLRGITSFQGLQGDSASAEFKATKPAGRTIFTVDGVFTLFWRRHHNDTVRSAVSNQGQNPSLLSTPHAVSTVESNDFLENRSPVAARAALELEHGQLRTTVITRLELLARARTARQRRAVGELIAGLP